MGWHLLVMPISKIRGQEIRSSPQLPTEISDNETIPSTKLRIQVAKEARKNKVLKKGHRNIEVPWPIHSTMKRKRLEKEYIQLKKRKMAQKDDDELQSKIKKMKEKD